MAHRSLRLTCAGALLLSLLALRSEAARAADAALSHDVFFTLKDGSEAARAKLLAACRKYLTGHEGTLVFSAGTLTAENKRPVNDRDFDIALHIVFESKAAHDEYQEAARHKQFIQEMSDNWAKVRVFDSTVTLEKR